jgi:hypothetical protein
VAVTAARLPSQPAELRNAGSWEAENNEFQDVRQKASTVIMSPSPSAALRNDENIEGSETEENSLQDARQGAPAVIMPPCPPAGLRSEDRKIENLQKSAKG